MCARKRISNGIFSYYDQIDGFVYCPPFFCNGKNYFTIFPVFSRNETLINAKTTSKCQSAHCSKVVNGFQTVAKTIFIFVNILQEKKDCFYAISIFSRFQQTHFQTKLLFFGKRRRKIITDAQKSTHLLVLLNLINCNQNVQQSSLNEITYPHKHGKNSNTNP